MKQLDIHQKFAPIFKDAKTRYTLLTGGRAGAKSFSAAISRCLYTYTPNRKCLYTRYTMTSAKKSIIPEFQEKIDLLGLQDDFTIRLTDIINNQTESQILFSGIKAGSKDQTANLKSIHGITSWVLEEAEEMTQRSDFEKIDESVRTDSDFNEVFVIMNPTDKTHWVYKEWLENSHRIEVIGGVPVPISTHPDVTHIHTTYLDNRRYLDKSFLKKYDALQTTHPERYAAKVIGNWNTVTTGDEFYSSFSEAKHVRQMDMPGNIHHLSFDQNVKPYITLVIAKIWQDGNKIHIHLFDEICSAPPQNTTRDLCEQYKTRYTPESLLYYGDASGNKDDTRTKLTDYDIVRSELKNYLTRGSNRVMFSNPSVKNRRDFINDIFDEIYPNITITIDPRCEKLITDLNKVKQDANGKKLKEKETRDGVSYEKYGHTSDAFDYLIVKALWRFWLAYVN